MIQCRESQLPVYCRLVHDKTVPYVSQLGEYGVNEGVLEQLRTMTEQFKGMVPETQVAISQSKEVTETIAEMFRKTTAILRDQLDGKMEQFKDSQTEFYHAYFNALSKSVKLAEIRLLLFHTPAYVCITFCTRRYMSYWLIC